MVSRATMGKLMMTMGKLMIKSKRALLLAGVSGLAMLVSAAGANADIFGTPGELTFIAPGAGEYVLEVFGASGGGNTLIGASGGLGAEVSGDIFLTKGEVLTLFVGGRGQSSSS